MGDGHYKDQILDRLAEHWNVAQFVSFDPGLRQRFARIHGDSPNVAFDSVATAVGALLERSPERSVNIRTFDPERPKSREFVYGLKTVADTVGRLQAFAAAGLNTIVNETIDVNDGGVSGVVFGDLVEFAPGDTPRCVEKPGTAALPRRVGFELFDTVYGFIPEVPADQAARVEFSLHPLRRGYHHRHTIVWEIEAGASTIPGPPDIRWPNRFSRFIGDKAFGLLVATLLGFDVPHTIVFPRRVAPFSFGAGGSAEPWIRTCPTVQVPGRFTTSRGWLDPYQLMQSEDADGTAIASVLRQRGVDAVAAGAAISQADGALLIEGVHGLGDNFMVGERPPEALPSSVEARVRETYAAVENRLGPARFEWADDGTRVWILQLHSGASVSSGRIIVPGDPPRFRPYRVADGLEPLRVLVDEVKQTGEGIVLVGFVGVTSHFGDVLRRAGVPSRLEAPESDARV
jgi:hypothetical protein